MPISRTSSASPALNLHSLTEENGDASTSVPESNPGTHPFYPSSHNAEWLYQLLENHPHTRSLPQVNEQSPPLYDTIDPSWLTSNPLDKLNPDLRNLFDKMRAVLLSQNHTLSPENINKKLQYVTAFLVWVQNGGKGLAELKNLQSAKEMIKNYMHPRSGLWGLYPALNGLVRMLQEKLPLTFPKTQEWQNRIHEDSKWGVLLEEITHRWDGQYDTPPTLENRVRNNDQFMGWLCTQNNGGEISAEEKKHYYAEYRALEQYSVLPLSLQLQITENFTVTNIEATSTIATSTLDALLNRLSTADERLGYAPKTIKIRKNDIKEFDDWLQVYGTSLLDFDPSVSAERKKSIVELTLNINTYLEDLKKRLAPNEPIRRLRIQNTLNDLINFLVDHSASVTDD